MRHTGYTNIHCDYSGQAKQAGSSRKQDQSLEISFAEQLDLTGRVRIKKNTPEKGKHWLHLLSAHSYGYTKINTHQLPRLVC